MTANNRLAQHYINPKTPNRDPRTLVVWRGWADYRAGRSFSPDYETMPFWDQRNYEKGRQLAALVHGHRGKVPTWPVNQHLSRLLYRQGVTFVSAVEDLFAKDNERAVA